MGDLIQAKTAAQRLQALRQMDGVLSSLYEAWRHRLVRHLAHLEADIDFPDEDLPAGVAAAVAPEIRALKTEIEEHLADGGRGEKLRDGLRIVILGEPNVGKSTLLNHLAAADVAIVTDEAGTTRDILDVQLDLGGFPVRLLDTAGIRGGDVGLVETEGIRRAKELGKHADVRLLLVAQKDWPGLPDDLKDFAAESFILITKCDEGAHDLDLRWCPRDRAPPLGVWPVSVHTGYGIEAFLRDLTVQVTTMMDSREAPVLTRARHRMALSEAVEALSRFDAQAGCDAVLAAEEIRLAARALGRITGRVDVEDLLDVIFADFCIGK